MTVGVLESKLIPELSGRQTVSQQRRARLNAQGASVSEMSPATEIYVDNEGDFRMNDMKGK